MFSPNRLAHLSSVDEGQLDARLLLVWRHPLPFCSTVLCIRDVCVCVCVSHALSLCVCECLSEVSSKHTTFSNLYIWVTLFLIFLPRSLISLSCQFHQSLYFFITFLYYSSDVIKLHRGIKVKDFEEIPHAVQIRAMASVRPTSSAKKKGQHNPILFPQKSLGELQHSLVWNS